eukprot:c15142_g1_i1.p1 GENE.c15142_g1_i1~~c15142_g1_i1.p1  ORF type:complete len:147 (+),score=43.86 c15142_g1_i1:21-461(+)
MNGKILLSGLMVFDLTGLNYRHAQAVTKWANSIGVLEANMPESVSAVFVINAPWIFEKMYTFIKPVLNAGTQKKVRIFQSGIEELKEYVSDENMLDYLGGQLKWPESSTLGLVPKGSLYEEFGKAKPEMWYGPSLQFSLTNLLPTW